MSRHAFAIERTTFFIACGTIVSILIMVARLVHLQIHAAPVLYARSQRNYMRHEAIKSPRGNIVDRHGMLLATNRPVVKIVWEGSGGKVVTADQKASLDQLSLRLGIEIPSERDLTKIERQRRRVTLVDDVSFDQLGILLELFPEHQNIRIETDFQRYYPFGTTACHVLGYIGDLSFNQSGIMGLEKAYDTALRGENGQSVTTINACGHPLSREAVRDAQPGSEICTTLDIEWQKIAEDCLPEGSSGTIIVMDARTGALRVVLSRPSFDPNLFVKPIPSALWKELVGQSSFVNRAFAACYPPASLFKLVTLIAGLDTRLISPSETWYCPGYTVFCGRKYHCNNKTAHGSVSIQSALIQSCNAPFFDIGRRIKIDTLAQYARWLGLGTATNALCGEKHGIVPTTDWKMATYREKWYLGETLSVAIGQGFLLATPIQLCLMVNTICQGYMVAPHLVAGSEIQQRPVPIQDSILQTIKQYMKHVVSLPRGTGHQLSRLKEMHIYAKTGTAQTCALKDSGASQRSEIPHGWFTAHVCYKDHDPITMIVFVEHAGSSKVAADITKQFLSRYRASLDAQDNH